MADVYKGIADSTRREILDMLAGGEEMTLFEICTRLLAAGTTSTRQAVSQHLAVLEECDLVRTTRAGRTKMHRMNPEPLREIVARWPLG